MEDRHKPRSTKHKQLTVAQLSTWASWQCGGADVAWLSCPCCPAATPAILSSPCHCRIKSNISGLYPPHILQNTKTTCHVPNRVRTKLSPQCCHLSAMQGYTRLIHEPQSSTRNKAMAITQAMCHVRREHGKMPRNNEIVPEPSYMLFYEIYCLLLPLPLVSVVTTKFGK